MLVVTTIVEIHTEGGDKMGFRFFYNLIVEQWNVICDLIAKAVTIL